VAIVVNSVGAWTFKGSVKNPVQVASCTFYKANFSCNLQLVFLGVICNSLPPFFTPRVAREIRLIRLATHCPPFYIAGCKRKSPYKADPSCNPRCKEEGAVSCRPYKADFSCNLSCKKGGQRVADHPRKYELQVAREIRLIKLATCNLQFPPSIV
jgi:hypothetical protein